MRCLVIFSCLLSKARPYLDLKSVYLLHSTSAVPTPGSARACVIHFHPSPTNSPPTERVSGSPHTLSSALHLPQALHLSHQSTQTLLNCKKPATAPGQSLKWRFFIQPQALHFFFGQKRRMQILGDCETANDHILSACMGAPTLLCSCVMILPPYCQAHIIVKYETNLLWRWRRQRWRAR